MLRFSDYTSRRVLFGLVAELSVEELSRRAALERQKSSRRARASTRVLYCATLTLAADGTGEIKEICIITIARR